ncbi:MAG: class I SAM-dependent methyltransferase [Candidatus Micrarchaeales archaeon]
MSSYGTFSMKNRSSLSKEGPRTKLSDQLLSIFICGNSMELSDQLGPILRKDYETYDQGIEAKAHFWNMLAATVPETGYVIPEGRLTTILDVACGFGEELRVLDEYFGGGRFGKSNNNTRIVGIDIHSRAIEWQRRNLELVSRENELKTKSTLPERIELVVGDATALSNYPQIPEKADVIVIRHPYIQSDRVMWTKIFEQAVNRLSEEGIMILTTHSDEEKDMVLEVLGTLKCRVVINKRNPFAGTHYGVVVNGKEAKNDRNAIIVKTAA